MKKVKAVHITHYCKKLTCEMAMIQISHGKRIFVAVTYISPSEKLEDNPGYNFPCYRQKSAENHPLIIKGNINEDILKSPL